MPENSLLTYLIANVPLVFPGVNRFPYDGVVLVELRDFYDQLIYAAFKEKSKGYDFGKPLVRLMDAVDVIQNTVASS